MGILQIKLLNSVHLDRSVSTRGPVKWAVLLAVLLTWPSCTAKPTFRLKRNIHEFRQPERRENFSDDVNELDYEVQVAIGRILERVADEEDRDQRRDHTTDLDFHDSVEPEPQTSHRSNFASVLKRDSEEEFLKNAAMQLGRPMSASKRVLLDQSISNRKNADIIAETRQTNGGRDRRSSPFQENLKNKVKSTAAAFTEIIQERVVNPTAEFISRVGGPTVDSNFIMLARKFEEKRRITTESMRKFLVELDVVLVTVIAGVCLLLSVSGYLAVLLYRRSKIVTDMDDLDFCGSNILFSRKGGFNDMLPFAAKEDREEGVNISNLVMNLSDENNINYLRQNTKNLNSYIIENPCVMPSNMPSNKFNNRRIYQCSIDI